MTPDTPPQRPDVTFDNLFDLAMKASYDYKKTYAHALDLGIYPDEILRYATAQMQPAERDRFQSMLLQSPWALNRVAAVVKAQREWKIEVSAIPKDPSAGCEFLDQF